MLGGIIAITHRGVLEVEELRDKPEVPTKHFPAFNVINVGTMIGSQISQASPASSQQITIGTDEKSAIENLIRELREKTSELALQAEDLSELRAEIATLESQLQSSRPKSNILRECLRTVRGILEHAAGASKAPVR